jgi:N utilization substance protein A
VFTPAMLVALGDKGVKTLDDLGDLASDELIEIVGAEAMEEDTANSVIMAARAHWFDGEDGETPEAVPAGAEGETGHDS